MKKFLLAAVSLLSVSAFAFGEVRVDFRGGAGQALENVKVSSGIFWYNKKYADTPDSKSMFYTTSQKLTDQWQKLEISFTPETSGKVSISFLSPGSSNKDKILPVRVDNVTADGIEIKNGSFETLNRKGLPSPWRMGKAKLVTDDGADGSNCIQVTYGEVAFYVAKVEAGKPVTLSFMAKLGKKDAENK